MRHSMRILAALLAAAVLSGCTTNKFEVIMRQYNVENSDHSTITAKLDVDKEGGDSNVLPQTTLQSIDTKQIAEAISTSIVELLKKFLESYLK